MTDKKFWCLDGYEGEISVIVDGKFAPTNGWLCDKLNKLYEENQQLKSILQDMGLRMSDEEVKNIRDEIASKLIKTYMLNQWGINVDVNTENGFLIIPKEVNNDRE